MPESELYASFIAEIRDAMDEVEPTLIQLGAAGGGTDDLELINAVFRVFHSTKGSAGFLQLDQVAGLTHQAEALLDLFRKGKARFEDKHVDLLCQALDVLRRLADVIESTQSDAGLEADVEMMTRKLSDAVALQSGEGEQGRGIVKGSVEAADDESGIGHLVIGEEAEVIAAFASDARELLDATEQALLTLSKGPDRPHLHLSNALRSIHTFKGNSSFLGFLDLEKLSHRIESVVEGMREGQTEVSESDIGVLLQIVDVLREGVIGLVEGGDGTIAAVEVYGQLLEEIVPYQESPTVKTSAEESDQAGPTILVAEEKEAGLDLVSRALGCSGYQPLACPDPQQVARLLAKGGQAASAELLLIDVHAAATKDQELVRLVRKEHPDLPIVALTDCRDKETLGELASLGVAGCIERPFAVSQLLAAVSEALARRKAAAKTGGAGTQPAKPLTVRRDIRIDVSKLDSLMNLVGELVIAESMVTRNPEVLALKLKSFRRATRQLRRITGELQDLAMAMRMVPVANAFRKMIRTVHDLSRKTGKKVQLVRRGEETEVDKNVIEQIADPLVHAVRNAVDHGLENPAERKRAGKPEEGTITLEARHEGGEVWVMVRDDGRGLSRDRILAKGIERGLVEGQGERLSDGDVYRLILEPGFSTAAEVTDISGRGVGMDVVKKNIDKLGGKIDVHSSPGKGTTIIMRIPLTLAIIEGMLVVVGQTRYTIPLVSVRESLRVAEGAVVRTMDGQEILHLREEMIPILRLHEIHHRVGAVTDLDRGVLVVLQDRDTCVALLVDKILDQQQAVIKGLSDYLGDARGISGCTILGDGEVSLILDAAGLIEMAVDVDTATFS